MAQPLTLARLAPPALVEGAARYTSAEVAALADERAGAYERGQIVAFDGPPSLETVVTYFALWRAGAVAAPLHHRLTERERAHLVERYAAHSEPPGSDVAVLLATSGSSGVPKIVRHGGDGLARKGAIMAAAHGLTPDDVILMPAPLAHVSGLLNGILVPGAAGMTTVLMERWSPSEALELIEADRVSFMIGPPTFFVQLAAEPSFSPERVASLRLLSCGGAGVTAEWAKQASETFGAVVKRTYGSTEAPTITTSYVGDPPEKGWETDGRVTGDVEVRLDGEELLCRGSELFLSYADGSGRDADGWYRTGDRARIEDGWLVCLGRLGDTIIRGGENVDPVEVEIVCARIPGVRQAVVGGVPDDVMGERIGLAVVADAPVDVDAVKAHCAEEGLARFKVPEKVVTVAEMPTLTVGKPDKKVLKALLAAAP